MSNVKDMRYKIIKPSGKVKATIDLPSSKSMSNRALMISALAGKHILPSNLSDCDDTRVMLQALREMPAEIDIRGAGTAMRFMTAYLSCRPGVHTLTGTERMKRRPIGVLVEALRELGATIDYAGETGYPPLHITGGPLDGGEIAVDGSVSSQYISALLMTGPVMRHGLTLHLTGDIISRPYIDLTLWMMGEFIADARWEDSRTIMVKPVEYTEREYYIENDWSAASYWYETVALSEPGSEVTLTGLADGSKQGDSSVRYIFSLLGVRTTFNKGPDGKPGTLTLTRTMRKLPRFEYDMVNAPDLAQTIIATCIALDIPFHFTGLQTLKIKETDRIEAMKSEMRKIGYVLKDARGRELMWEGERCPVSAEPVIDTYDDHRMALAFAPLCLKRGSMTISEPMVVTKSYPRYWDDMRRAGFTVEEE